VQTVLAGLVADGESDEGAVADVEAVGALALAVGALLLEDALHGHDLDVEAAEPEHADQVGEDVLL
jgi:hypothetical protein